MTQLAVTEIAMTAAEIRAVNNRDRKRKLRRATKEKAARDARKAALAAKAEEERLQLLNLAEYRQMNLSEKLKFAHGGYIFARAPGIPAVTIGTTNIRMNNGKARGVFCGKALQYLPDNFVLTFAVASTTTREPKGGQRQFMVATVGEGGVKTYHLLEPNPRGLSGVANLVNCALTRTNVTEAQKKFTHDTGQDMRLELCGLVYNTSPYVTSDERIRDPFYMSLNKGSSNKNPGQRVNYSRVLCPGREILMERNYGGEHYV